MDKWNFPFHQVCGNDLPSPSAYSSTSNEMTIRFVSDESQVYKGFKAKYETGCGALIVAESSGVISTPGYPNVAQNFNCNWTIVGSQPSDRVTLTTTHIQVLSLLAHFPP